MDVTNVKLNTIAVNVNIVKFRPNTGLNELTWHHSAPPLRRHHRGRGVEGASRGVERHPVRRWKGRRGERRRMRRSNEAETFQDALAHFLHLVNQLGLRRWKQSDDSVRLSFTPKHFYH